MKRTIFTPTQTEQKDKKSGVLLYLVLLTSFFLLLEISFFIQINKAYLFDFQFVSSHLQIPSSIFPGILHFICAQLIVHASFCFFIAIIVFFIQQLLNLNHQAHFKLALSVWLLAIATVLTANQYLFPNSKFADLMRTLWFNPIVLKIALSVLLCLCLCVLVLAMAGFYKWSRKLCCLVSGAIIGLMVWSLSAPPQISYLTQSTLPNIFIIGIDSLRPDFLGFFGGSAKTPFFDKFLAHSTVFNDAVTPLARTFPSWTTILSGEYPKQIGIRFNLARQDHADFSQNLPHILQKLGYQTIFATDETRFSNIDHRFGFQKLITPPIGLNDFLLGTFNDFPISNLLVNTKLGSWLFPYSYANRAAFVTYEPATFLNRIKTGLHSVRTQPLFVAVHFCLPHYPYYWAQQPIDLSWISRYQDTVKQADAQVGGYVKWLGQNHLLKNAIVVILSDHGEALELSGDRITDEALFQKNNSQETIPHFYPPSLDTEAVNQSAGHGTDVLGLPQYHSLLAFHVYGRNQNEAIVSGVVALLDIKPTLLDFLQQTSQGFSLKPYILERNTQVTTNRDIFLESDFSPSAIRTLYPEERKVMLEGIELFRIDPKTTRLIVKDSMGQKIIHSKQLADIYQNWMLALYPQSSRLEMPVLVNLETGRWTNNPQSAFAQASPYSHMLSALRKFYGTEIDKISSP